MQTKEVLLCLLLFTLACEGSNGPLITHYWPSIASGDRFTCGLTDQGVAYCWGASSGGNLGTGVDTMSTLPARVASSVSFASISPGRILHSCGLTTGATAYCWGGNVFGELGDSTNTPRLAPVSVATSLRFSTISAGDRHTCAIATDGTAYCWGQNDVGQLGNFIDTTERRSPVAVYGSTKYQSVSAGASYTCAVATTGAGWCWGYNGGGQLGDSLYFLVRFPTLVEGGLTFKSISAGWSHTCGVTTSGAAYCWGLGTAGELGNDSIGTFLIPQAVAGGHRFTSVGSGERFSCGLTTDGVALCWGDGPSGELGNLLTSKSTVPIPVTGGLRFSSISVGQHHTCGIASDGQAYCWGANGQGQLGNGSTAFSFVPAPVGSPLE